MTRIMTINSKEDYLVEWGVRFTNIDSEKKNIKKYIGEIMYSQLYGKYWESANGQYIDQTMGNALAQIQIVVQKKL